MLQDDGQYSSGTTGGPPVYAETKPAPISMQNYNAITRQLLTYTLCLFGFIHGSNPSAQSHTPICPFKVNCVDSSNAEECSRDSSDSVTICHSRLVG